MLGELILNMGKKLTVKAPDENHKGSSLLLTLMAVLTRVKSRLDPFTQEAG